MTLKFAIIYKFIILILCKSTLQDCIISIKNDFTYQHPLILQVNQNDFILPNINNGLQFKTNQSLRLSCPGQNNLIAGTSLQEATIFCVANKTFTINNQNKTFNELKCLHYPESTSKYSGKNCSKIFSEILIGFNSTKGFVPLITTCFNKNTSDSLYSSFNLSSKINSHQYIPRPNHFIPGNFYPNLPQSPQTLYEKKTQRLTFEKILQSAELAAQYISLTSDFFLSRGHFTAKADFIYGSQQRATFYYINVAPQWQTMNSLNWNQVEMSSRNLAASRNLNLTIYTGMFGQAQLPDVNNNNRNLSLYFDYKKPALTVPEIYWKIVHDPLSSKGVVLISHNNPYNKNIKPVCNDVSNLIKWVSWDPKNQTSGFSYSCYYSEFKKAVYYAPELPIKYLLT